MAIDGFDWDTPDTAENAAEFGYTGSGANRSAFPKARVVTISECASHVVVAAAIGPMSSGEQTLARELYPDLEADWLLIGDRNFHGYHDFNTARASGAQLLWRVSASVTLPVLAAHPDGSYASVLINPKIRGAARARLVESARRGAALDPDQAVALRVVEYTVPDREGNKTGELIALITTITDPRHASAEQLAQAYHQRWEHETGNKQLKTPPTRTGQDPAVEETGHRPPGNLWLPADPLRDQRPGLTGRHRPRPSQVPAHRTHHPPPGR
jgi:hypothetical protein